MAVATSKAMTSATTKIYIGAAQPTTYDEAGFEAVTWTEIGEVTSIGQLGGTNSVITHIPLGTSVVVKRTGSTNYGTLDLQGARCDDTGIAALRAAFDSKLSKPFKVVYPPTLGEVDYFTGVVTSATTNVGNADQILGFAANVDIDNTILTAEV